MVLLYSCDASKLELSNPNELLPETYFQNETQVESAVNAIYGSLQTRGIYNRHIWFGYDNMAHENSGNPQLESDKVQYLQFTFDASHGPIGAFWESCYRGINKANFVINNKDQIDEILDSEMPQARKDKFIGEAKFLRALYYFMLVDRFGDVPLILDVPTPETEGYGRTPAAQIWDQIEADLLDAASKCLAKANEELGRATSGAAWALLGKARLFQGDYDGALQAFGNVTGYSLEPRYLNNFEEETENGRESVFEVQFISTGGANANAWSSDRSDQGLNESCFRGQEYGWNNWFNVYPSEDLLDEFEANDPRYKYCFYSVGDTFNNGNDIIEAIQYDRRAGWRKYQTYYKRTDEAQQSGVNMKIIRYADVMLMTAEALANSDYAANDDEATALINDVRARDDVNMPAIATPATLTDFMDALEHERKVELCGEQVRFPDLLRWGKLTNFITNTVGGTSFQNPKNLLWPIPQDEIDRNENISQDQQNTGY